MTEQKTPYRKELGDPTRTLLVLLGLGLSVLLAVAAFLKPHPHHFGTHQQLGLPPCTFYAVFGMPCPTCGMTTAWAHLMRGEILTAVRVNAGGAMLAVWAILVVPWSLVTAIRGRHFAWLPRGSASLWIAAGIFAVVLLQWGCRLIGLLHG